MILMLLGEFLLLNDAAAWYYRGVSGATVYTVLWVVNWMTFFVMDMIQTVSTVYINYRINGKQIKKDGYLYCCMIAISIDLVFLFISAFTQWYFYIDEYNYYHRAVLSFVTPMCAFFSLGVNAINLIVHRKNMNKQLLIALLLSVLLPIFAAIYQYGHYGASYVNAALIIALINVFVCVMAEQGRNSAEETKKLSQMKTELLISQIGPHFIFNVLGTIKHLCRTNPREAEETIDEFSTYLRGNIDSLKNALFKISADFD